MRAGCQYLLQFSIIGQKQIIMLSLGVETKGPDLKNHEMT